MADKNLLATMRFTNGGSFFKFVKNYSSGQSGSGYNPFLEYYHMTLKKGERITFSGMDSSRVFIVEFSFWEKELLSYSQRLKEERLHLQVKHLLDKIEEDCADKGLFERFERFEDFIAYFEERLKEDIKEEILNEKGFTIEKIRQNLKMSNHKNLRKAIVESVKTEKKNKDDRSPKEKDYEIKVYKDRKYAIGDFFVHIYESLKGKSKEVKKDFDLQIEFREEKIIYTEENLGIHEKLKYGEEELDLEEVPMDNLKEIPFPFLGIPTEAILNTLPFFGNLSEIIALEYNEGNERLILSQERADARNTILMSKEMGLDFPKSSDIVNHYSLIYLKGWIMLLEAQMPSDHIILGLRKDHPMRLMFNIEPLNLSFNGFLAPRIEETEFGSEDGKKYGNMSSEKGKILKKVEDLYDILIRARILEVYLPELEEVSSLRDKIRNISFDNWKALKEKKEKVEKLEDEVNFKLEPLKREALSTYLILF